MEPERVAICQKPIFSQYFSFRAKSYEEEVAARTINTGRDRYFNGTGEKGKKTKKGIQGCESYGGGNLAKCGNKYRNREISSIGK